MLLANTPGRTPGNAGRLLQALRRERSAPQPACPPHHHHHLIAIAPPWSPCPCPARALPTQSLKDSCLLESIDIDDLVRTTSAQLERLE